MIGLALAYALVESLSMGQPSFTNTLAVFPRVTLRQDDHEMPPAHVTHRELAFFERSAATHQAARKMADSLLSRVASRAPAKVPEIGEFNARKSELLLEADALLEFALECFPIGKLRKRILAAACSGGP